MKEYEHNERVMTFILDDKVKTIGDKVFVRHKEDRITYAQLSEGSNKVANSLISEFNVGKGDKIAVMLPNGVDYFFVQFGIAKAGAIMVPINIQAKLDLLTHFLNACDAEMVVIDEQLLPLIRSIENEIPAINTLIVRGPELKKEAFTSTKDFNIVPYQELFHASPKPPQIEINWYDPVDIFYTSGTTGISKGIVLPYNHHYHFGLQIVEFGRLGPQDIMYICLPLYHGMGSYMCIMPMLICEGSIAMSDRFSASGWLKDIREYGATVTWAIYTMGPILMKQPVRKDDADNPLKVYLFSVMPPDMIEAFEKRFGVKLIESYGSTEQEDIAHTPWDERRYGAVGKINSKKYDVKIVNEHDEELAPGKEGEIVSRCKYPYTQMIEYYKMPEETVKTFRNRWLHSGDLGRIDEDGWLYFSGRGKDSIRRRGENISCYELENILSSYENIEESAAIPIPSELGEDDIKVIVVPKSGKSLDFQEVIDFCKVKMPKFMVPRYIEKLDELPKLPNQKVDKVKLKEIGLTPDTWDAEGTEEGDFMKK
jgi:crotonobetaine/carnitine-CoA ligase